MCQTHLHQLYTSPHEHRRTSTKCATKESADLQHFLNTIDSSDLPDDPEIRGRAVRATYKSKDYCSDNCRVKRWQRDQKYKKN